MLIGVDMRALKIAVVGLAVVTASAFAGTSAQAVSLSILGADQAESRNIPGNFNPPRAGINAINNFISQDGTSRDIRDERVLVFERNAGTPSPLNGLALTDFTGSVDVRFTFFGSEAGFRNFAGFHEDGVFNELFRNKGDRSQGRTPIGHSITLSFGDGPNDIALGEAGLLPFVYRTFSTRKNRDNRLADAANDESQNQSRAARPLEIGFTETIFTNAFGFGSTVAFFGDGTGDTDLDDLVVGIGILTNTVSTVPVPPALPLLATGLVALGWLRRRRSA